jgi:hypothetical protein
MSFIPAALSISSSRPGKFAPEKMINVKPGKTEKPCELQGKIALRYEKISDFSEGYGMEIQKAGGKLPPEIVSKEFLSHEVDRARERGFRRLRNTPARKASLF